MVDNRKGDFPIPYSTKLCSKFSVDGLIVLQESRIADFRMRIINRDGSEAEMCGNGLRCCLKFIEELCCRQPSYRIETEGGIHLIWSQGREVCVQIPPPLQHQWDLLIEKNYRLHHLTVGVPHVICFVDHIDGVEVNSLGNRWRHHPFFAPTGVNVTFVQLKDEHSIFARTYERGVEQETAACGTAAIAAALATAKIHGYTSDISVHVRSKERLKISFNIGWDQIVMQGPVTCEREVEELVL